jgi:hypothetical protein
MGPQFFLLNSKRRFPACLLRIPKKCSVRAPLLAAPFACRLQKFLCTFALEVERGRSPRMASTMGALDRGAKVSPDSLFLKLAVGHP